MRCVATYLWIGVVATSAAIVQPACGQQAAETPEQKTERALDEFTTLEFVNTPLQDVLKYLEDQHKVKFEFAPETKEGPKRVDPRLLVTKNLKSISLRSGLHLLLDRYELEVTMKPNGTLLLVPSTKELKARRVESPLQKKAHAKLNAKLLTETANAQFDDCPLKDVFAYLADASNCQIAFDHKALAERGISPDDELSCWLDELCLSRVLRCVLTPYDLKAVVQDEVLLIVGKDKNAKPDPSPEVAKALATKLDIDLAQPLHVIARHFTEKTGVPFLLHGAALKASKVQTDRVFVVKAQGVTPEEALKRIEPRLPLKVIERDGIVLVSIEARK